MSIPAWEVPFKIIGEVILDVPKALGVLSADSQEFKKIVDTDVPAFVQLLADATIAVTDRGLNFAVDGAVAKDFLQLFATLKQQFGIAAKKG